LPPQFNRSPAAYSRRDKVEISPGKITVSGQLGFKFSNGGDNHFGIFTCGTIIGAQIIIRFLGFDPGQYQRPAALGARWPKVVDELKIQRVHGTAEATPLPMG
jgi:hypothetical protein